MRRVRIKICGITREEDAFAAVELGADALGFVFYPPSPRFLSPGDARRIIERLPPFITTVGLFVDASASDVHAQVTESGVDLVQFHGKETPAECAASPRAWIKAIQARPGVDFARIALQYSGARALLIDAWHPELPGGTGVSFDWSLLTGPRDYPLVLAGGLDAGNVGAALRQLAPYAVDVSGGVESSKGIKNIAKMREFIAEVRNFERQA